MKTLNKETLAKMELFNSNVERVCEICEKTINAGSKYASTTGHAHYGTHICYECWLNGDK